MTTIRAKLRNILRNFHRDSPHPEADPDDVEATIDAVLRVAGALRAEHPTKNMMVNDAGRPTRAPHNRGGK